MEMKTVLDNGYVRLVDTMGSDLSVVNSARVSYNKEKHELESSDIRLIKFLAREGHTSPFRHATLQFEIYAPLMVARQHWKYVVGSDHAMDAWNESSRRYVSDDVEFYIPTPSEWRTKPDNSKQGSGKPLDSEEGYMYTRWLRKYAEEGERLYNEAMRAGIAPEQARLFLPAYALYVRYYWTASLQSTAHFLAQRLEHDSQFEIQQYAKAVNELVKDKFPHSLKELLKDDENGDE